ncbi:MAG TPA: hypothetical protein GX505_05805 [Clostridiales bacterium]|nr:hypothetical protein [Clostridiales bacterium]
MKKTKLRWMKLDNAAKIYPAAKRRNWSNVFRLSATLTENVDPCVLQNVLDKVVKRFPSISARIRRGMFWYYLEELPKAPKIQMEACHPLTHMPFHMIRKCAFRVLYYENRIAVELFHALTDGNGAMVFLKTLLSEYLKAKYNITVTPGYGVLDCEEDPREEELEDSFLVHAGDVKQSRRDVSAYRLRGTREPDGYINVITGILDVREVLAKAKSYKVSLTVFLAAVLIQSIIEMQEAAVPDIKKRKPVKILIPVDLRRIYGSESLRNFVLYVTPGVNPKLGTYTLEEIMQAVHHQMGVELTDKQMKMKIAKNVADELNPVLRFTPLFLKNIVMKLVYNAIGETKSCLTLSNLGAIKLPEEMYPYIKRMDFILGAQATRPNNCGVLSYGDKMYINFTRNIKESALERIFFTKLRSMGLHVLVESNSRS